MSQIGGFSADKKARAHGLVARAIAAGKLERQPCEDCGAVPTDAHHDDYDKPLEVRWKCKVHHRLRHVELQNADPRGQRRAISLRQLRDGTAIDEPVLVYRREHGLLKPLGLWVPMWLVEE